MDGWIITMHNVTMGDGQLSVRELLINCWSRLLLQTMMMMMMTMWLQWNRFMCAVSGVDYKWRDVRARDDDVTKHAMWLRSSLHESYIPALDALLLLLRPCPFSRLFIAGYDVIRGTNGLVELLWSLIALHDNYSSSLRWQLYALRLTQLLLKPSLQRS